MADYRFITKWVLEETTAEKAWEVLKSNNYQDWWQGVSVKVIEQGNEIGLGEVRESVFKTKLPYTLSFKNRVSKLECPSLIEMEAFGELEGLGRYEIQQVNDQTEIVYTWEVHTTKKWMNLMAPLMKPLFVWNHDQVMNQGGVGLANYLNARLVKNS